MRSRAAIAVLTALIGLGAAACTSGAATTASGSTTSRPSAAAPTSASASAADNCPAGTTPSVTTAVELTAALKAARPGDVIAMAPGTYTGNFVAEVSGTATGPITLCGPRSAVLDGGSTDHGYVLHLSGANYWRILGFSVRNGQKGVMTDAANHDVIAGLNVAEIGDEAVHLRSFSSDDVVRDNEVSDTGHDSAKFGEGIYVGSANKNWCMYSKCDPDRSDRNVLQGNEISGTTAENIDIKEGTTGGTITGNQLSGKGMVASAATAWINVKGNSWTVEDNTGSDSVGDGFQVHKVYDGWGLNNSFSANKAAVNGPGFGYYVQSKSLDAVVACSNTETGAAKGLSNLACRPN